MVDKAVLSEGLKISHLVTNVHRMIVSDFVVGNLVLEAPTCQWVSQFKGWVQGAPLFQVWHGICLVCITIDI